MHGFHEGLGEGEGTGRILGSKYDGCVTGKGLQARKQRRVNDFQPEMNRGELK